MLAQKGKSLHEWMKLYTAKTSDNVDLPSGFNLYYLAERGFATIRPNISADMMCVYQVCGDARFWHDYAEMMAYGLGLNHVGTVCTRSIRPYMRCFGWTLLDEKCENGQLRFLCQDSIGRAILITHKDIQENGEPEYWVVHYINKKATPTIDEFLNESELKNNVED